jgi:3-oxoacyl-[acyl-carrier protein] reductase
MKTNRVVVITGAAGGMGSVLVHRFLMNGDIVIATDIKSAPLEELRERHNADALITTVGDISKEKDCATLAELLRSKTTRGRCSHQLRRVLPDPPVRGDVA